MKIDLENDLNPKQREAVVHGKGPLLILAGAGSGKTRALTYRIAHLIERGDARPTQILAVTFTNKAANEMRERIDHLLGFNVGGLWVHTFHAAGARILRQYGEHIGLKPGFVIYDDADQLALIKLALNALNLDESILNARVALKIIESAKNRCLGPGEYTAPPFDPAGEYVEQVYRGYQTRLREANAVDFGDLLRLTVDLLRHHPEVAADLGRRWKYVLVDEFQDTNQVQYMMLKLLTAAGAELAVVGDDDQSIYGWRGANVKNMTGFSRDFKGTTTIVLDQNYRSTGSILKASHEVIRHNPGRLDKTLWTENEQGAPITCVTVGNERMEAEYVLKSIGELNDQKGLTYRDCAIFYRTHSQSRVFEELLIRNRIAYILVGGIRFYERKEIKDAVAYLRLTANPKSSVDFYRVLNTPPRGIGKTTAERIRVQAEDEECAPLEAARYLSGDSAPGILKKRARIKVAAFVKLIDSLHQASEDSAVADLCQLLLEETGYVENLSTQGTEEARGRIENLEELVSAAAFFDKSVDQDHDGLTAFLEHISLVSDVETSEAKSEAITLMTLHAAKGLEFKAVFLTGMENGIFPHERSQNEPKEMEEERRLCYVGMTRARQFLTITSAKERTIYGRTRAQEVSCFLDDLPEDLLRREEIGLPRPQFTRSKPKNREYQYSDPVYEYDFDQRRPEEDEMGQKGLTKGAQVYHQVFGEGIVRSIDGAGEKARVTVFFNDYGPKRIIAKFLSW